MSLVHLVKVILQYLEMAQKDQAFQNEALEILTEICQDLTELRTLRKELLSAIRLVSGATNRGDEPTKVMEPKKSDQPSTVLKHNAEQTRSGPYSTPHIQHSQPRFQQRATPQRTNAIPVV
jgi:hypothetical protein